MDIAEVLRGAAVLLRARAALLFAVAVPAAVPSVALDVLSPKLVQTLERAFADMPPILAGLLSTFSLVGAISATGMVSHALVIAIATKVAVAARVGATEDDGALLRAALRAWPALMVLHAVTAVITTVGALMCIVPGLFLSFALALAPSLLVDQRVGVFDALRSGFDLSRGARAEIFFAMIAASLPLLGLRMAVERLVFPGFRADLLAGTSLVAICVTGALSVLIQLYQSLVTAEIYARRALAPTGGVERQLEVFA